MVPGFGNPGSLGIKPTEAAFTPVKCTNVDDHDIDGQRLGKRKRRANIVHKNGESTELPSARNARQTSLRTASPRALAGTAGNVGVSEASTFVQLSRATDAVQLSEPDQARLAKKAKKSPSPFVDVDLPVFQQGLVININEEHHSTVHKNGQCLLVAQDAPTAQAAIIALDAPT